MSKSLDIGSIIREHLKPIFFKYDKDSNSTLSKEELRQLLAQNLGITIQNVSKEQLDWHFQRIDENKDGKITFEEYFSHFFEQKAKESNKNEDQVIDIAEFRKLMENTFKPLNIAITEEMVLWNFKKIDTDNSGHISFEEYVKFVKKYNS